MAQHAHNDESLDSNKGVQTSADSKKAKQSKEEYDWFEDPFNDEKNEADLNAARHSQRRSCIIILIVFIVVVLIIVLLIGGCSILSSMSGAWTSNWV